MVMPGLVPGKFVEFFMVLVVQADLGVPGGSGVGVALAWAWAWEQAWA